MKKTNKKILREISIIINLLILIIVNANASYAVSAALESNSGIVQHLYFTGTSSGPNKWYQDGISTNPDVGIKLCDLGQKYVGATYAAKINDAWKYVLVSYHSSTDALAYTDSTDGSTCYKVSPSYLTISPSSLTTPNPDVYYAAFPGRLEIAYADSANPGTLTNFVFADGNGGLAGSYSIDRSFSESDDTVTLQTPVINFQTSSGTFSKVATDQTFGLNNDKRRMVVACCDDDAGTSCSDGYVVPTEANFPMSLNTGLSSSDVNDQHTYTKYIVINGLGNQMCIGANLETQVTSITPNPVYYGQTLHISFKITNPRNTPYEIHGGNVRVTNPFAVLVKIYNATNPSNVISQQTVNVNNPVPVDGEVDVNVDWPAQAHSGTYTVEVDVDSNNNIAECNENDNTAKANFVLKPVYIPNVEIDSVSSIHFGYPGVPYDFSIHMQNSDGNDVGNATVQVVEENGLDIFGPTQIWNLSTSNTTTAKSGLKSFNIAQFTTDYEGKASMTLIPTGNKLYSPEYNYTNASNYVGDYKMYLRGWTSSGEEMIFTINGEITNEYPLILDNPYTYLHANQKIIVNEDSFVKPILDFVYESFATFWKSIIH